MFKKLLWLFALLLLLPAQARAQRPSPAYSSYFTIWLESTAVCDSNGLDTLFVDVELFVASTKLSPHPRFLRDFVGVFDWNPSILTPVTTGVDAANFFTADTTNGGTLNGGLTSNFTLPFPAACSGTGDNVATFGTYTGDLVPLPYGTMVPLGKLHFYILTANIPTGGVTTFVTLECRRVLPGDYRLRLG